jgi:hypothetical protein
MSGAFGRCTTAIPALQGRDSLKDQDDALPTLRA